MVFRYLFSFVVAPRLAKNGTLVATNSENGGKGEGVEKRGGESDGGREEERGRGVEGERERGGRERDRKREGETER